MRRKAKYSTQCHPLASRLLRFAGERFADKKSRGCKRFKRAAIALNFMAAIMESHGDVTGVAMVKQWAGRGRTWPAFVVSIDLSTL
jgi:hypothetical protein